MRAMDKERSARYASANELLSDVTALLDDPTRSTERAKITGPRRRPRLRSKSPLKIARDDVLARRDIDARGGGRHGSRCAALSAACGRSEDREQVRPDQTCVHGRDLSLIALRPARDRMSGTGTGPAVDAPRRKG
jgi:hypothetical protein